MEEAYIKSLHMIKILNLKSEKEYIKLVSMYLVLNYKSLKYISKKNSFKDIANIAREVE